MKVGSLSLGCKTNTYDTEKILAMFRDKGYEIADEKEPADIFIINTCSVTNMAERKSRQAVERVMKLNPNAVIVMTGCYAQVKPDEVRNLHNVSVVVGTRDRKDIVELTERYMTSGENQARISDISRDTTFEEIDSELYSSRTRLQLKVQDGCNNFCSYCIIPYARGRIASNPMENVLASAEKAIEKDVKEIVLTGIHIASYGKDIGKYGLADLVEAIHKKTEGTNVRIRIGSLDPTVVTEEFGERMSKLERLCPQFHLSLQSGSTTVLKRMNRHYTADEYFECTRILRKFFNSPSITTDIIVGFPQETEEEFAETLAFAEKVRFAKIHIFPYSRREGTVAAKMDGQIPHSVAVEREKRLSVIEEETRREYIESYVGKTAEVLFEETKEINGMKYTCGYTPEYIYVLADADDSLHNTIRKVRLTKAYDEFAEGTVEN